MLIHLQDQVKVNAIFVDEDRVKRAGPGENLRIRLSGVEEEDILSGFVLSSVGKDFFSPSFKYFAGLLEDVLQQMNSLESIFYIINVNV